MRKPHGVRQDGKKYGRQKIPRNISPKVDIIASLPTVLKPETLHGKMGLDHFFQTKQLTKENAETRCIACHRIYCGMNDKNKTANFLLHWAKLSLIPVVFLLVIHPSLSPC